MPYGQDERLQITKRNSIITKKKAYDPEDHEVKTLRRLWCKGNSKKTSVIMETMGGNIWRCDNADTWYSDVPLMKVFGFINHIKVLV